MRKKLTSFFILKNKKIGENRYWLFSAIFFLFFFNIGITRADDRNCYYDEYIIKYKNNKNLEIVDIDGKNNKSYEFRNDLHQEIEYIEPNYKYNMAIVPSDAYYEMQWYLKKIKAEEAWNIAREAEEIIIAIVDSGVWIDHPDLIDNIWLNKEELKGNSIDDDKNGFIDDINGWDFVNNEADPRPKFKDGFTQDGITHGTIIAGIAAASGNNASGIAGVVWRAKLMPLKVLDDKGEGNTVNVIKAIDYAIANGADIINFSFVGEGNSKSLEAAIRRAYEAGIIIIAAAGNELKDGQGALLDVKPMYPVCHDGSNGENMIIGVAALDSLDQKAVFSSYGHDCVDISAPGISIYSTTVYSPDNNIGDIEFNKYYDGYWSGTSITAPMVSATAALLQEVNSKLSRDEIVDVVLQSADNISRLNPNYLGELGSGRLNVYNSVSTAKSLIADIETRLIVAPYQDRISNIKIMSADGKSINEFLSYNEAFRGGVNVAVGDIDGDGVEEIITGAGFTGGPHVRIFDNTGKVEGQFFAYDKNFRGGVNVAMIDMDNKSRNTKNKIITSPGIGGGPQLRFFDNHGEIVNQFFAFHENFRGGVNIAVGDINSNGLDEIITAAGPGGSPHVRIFDKYGVLLESFYAFEDSFLGGVNVGVISY
ncbi:MAG: S8 family peptidase [Patescibacteria group bacterium]|nr:S8 family peptidase [Patescibacteria group bacterium]